MSEIAERKGERRKDSMALMWQALSGNYCFQYNLS